MLKLSGIRFWMGESASESRKPGASPGEAVTVSSVPELSRISSQSLPSRYSAPVAGGARAASVNKSIALTMTGHLIDKHGDGYFAVEPGEQGFWGITRCNLPSLCTARIMPLDSMPRIFLGSRFTSINTCFPTTSSGW